ncbi:MAG: hypothetical protein JSV91_05030 [Phycisphaerales bacterium]|nr:MAG: hypothetical protein JSV91_05030 [Phycisphaerales bacterium]
MNHRSIIIGFAIGIVLGSGLTWLAMTTVSTDPFFAPILISPPPPLPEDTDPLEDNAALAYWQAMDLLAGYLKANPTIEPALSEYMREVEIEPTPDLRERIENLWDDFWADLDRAVAKPFCHFGIAREEGMMATLPHLQGMRQCGAIMLIDAQAALDDEDGERAARRLASCLRIASHIGEDRTTISSSIAMRILMKAERLVRSGLERDMFNAEAREVLVAEIQRISSQDPLGMMSSLVADHDWLVPWMQRTYGVPGGLRAYNDLVMPPATVLGITTQREMNLALQALGEYMGEVVEAYKEADPDLARRKISDIAQRMDADPDGAMARRVAGKFVSDWYDQLIDVRQRLSSLAGDLSGQWPAESNAEPAKDKTSAD